MSSLEEQLERCIKRQGENSPVVQMLRNQISSEKRGVLADRDRQLIVTGAKPPA